MKQLKFNRYERVAGLFVLVAVGGFLLSMLGVAIRQGWFDSKVDYTTIFQSAEGLHPGSRVEMSGLSVGSVTDVDLIAGHKVEVRFYVLKRFADKIKKDSVTQLVRPFLIGERVLDVSLGEEQSQSLAAGGPLLSVESTDLMSLISSRELGSTLSSMGGALGNLKTLAEAFLDKNKTQSIVQSMERIDPLLRNLNVMTIEVIKLTKQLNKDENVGYMVGQLAETTRQINDMLPDVRNKAPKMAKDLTELVSNMAVLTEQFKVVIPALTEIAPDLPRASRRALEALDEAVVLIKSMEKSMFVRGNAEEVRKEEAEAAKQKKRVPANNP